MLFQVLFIFKSEVKNKCYVFISYSDVQLGVIIDYHFQLLTFRVI